MALTVQPLILSVIGSRDFSNYAQLADELDRFVQNEGQPITEIVSGGAAGADTLAERYARERGIPLRVFRPDYAAHGRAAPLIRNQAIIDAATCVLAFWNGHSKGTAHSLRLARKRGIRLIVVVPLP
jgi:hypothetical protein